MACRRFEGLPFLPGNCYSDPTTADFRRSQTLDCVNGFKIPKVHYLGVGSVPIPELCQSVKDIFSKDNFDPNIIYGKPKVKCCNYVPPWVANEAKCIQFQAYTKETVNDSQLEYYRVRPVDIRYHLEDDTISVYEPRIENSGLMQGPYIKRHQIPKNDLGETWNWKDLDLRCDVMFYGRAFRIVDCDTYTREFYESEGIMLNEPEDMPKDPYIDGRESLYRKKFGNNCCDRRPKYQDFAHKPLRFYCVWDDRHNEFGELAKYDLFFYLDDGTIEVKEINCRKLPGGREISDSRLLLHRIRLPKDWKDLPLQFPLGTMEAKEPEYVEYYEVEDLKIGETILVFGRRFLIYDLDDHAKNFYRTHFGMNDFTPICVFPTEPEVEIPREIPPWNGWGSPEDSLASVLHIIPQRPKIDDLKKLVLELKVLRFGAVLDSTKPEDIGREFTISYRLVDDKICIYERAVRNSGWPAGKFLDYIRVMKPGSSKDCPEYYGPFDFYIGAMLDVYGHRFCIRCADRFVLEFAEKNPECFPDYIVENLKNFFDCLGQREICEQPCDPGARICEEPVGESFFEQLGLGYGKNRFIFPCNENPNPNPCPYDWDMCRQLGYNCGVQRPDLEVGDRDPIDYSCDKPCPGNPDMFEQQQCAVYRPEKLLAPKPMMPNPKIIEDPQCTSAEDYYLLKENRFGCYNPPSTERQTEALKRKSLFACPCNPPGQIGDVPDPSQTPDPCCN